MASLLVLGTAGGAWAQQDPRGTLGYGIEHEKHGDIGKERLSPPMPPAIKAWALAEAWSSAPRGPAAPTLGRPRRTSEANAATQELTEPDLRQAG